MLEYENELYKKGITLIAGVDEVGRGPLFGPVVAAAVILPVNFYNEKINDSKKLTEKKREELYDVIKENAISIGVGIISQLIVGYDSVHMIPPSHQFLIFKISINFRQITLYYTVIQKDILFINKFLIFSF